jgi:hypothetical protein
LFSVERTENNKQQALRAFKAEKHRVVIDFFLLPSSQWQKNVKALIKFIENKPLNPQTLSPTKLEKNINLLNFNPDK